MGNQSDPVIITDKKTEEDWKPVRAVQLDEVRERVSNCSYAEFAARCLPEQLCYVMHTSGSTGRPQGVMVSHAALTQTLSWRQAAFPLSAEDRWLQLIRLGFDPSLADLLSPALAGAAVIFPGASLLHDPTQLVRFVRQYRITVLQAVPSLLNVLLEAATSRHVLPCEWFSAEVNHFQQVCANGFTLFCPACSSICMDRPKRQLTQQVMSARDSGHMTVPIGRPGGGRTTVVLDQNGRLCPQGTPGEPAIGGTTLARGYVGDPGKTAERFIPDPFSGVPGARMFLTRDIVHWGSDGNLNWRSRRDRLVKIRGVRVELAEIEDVLRRHPRLVDVAVLADADGTIAYLVPRGNAGLSAGALIEYASARLPEVMIPRQWHLLPELPRTGTGKVDVLRLPAMESVSLQPEGQASPPRNALELWLVELCRAILEVDAFGIHDNFFTHGGNSLRAAMLANRLQDQLQEYLYAVAVFDAPTVAELAQLLQRDYPQAIASRFGLLEGKSIDQSNGSPASPVCAEDLVRFRNLVRSLPERSGPTTVRNPQAIFLLSAPRSGSTLTRVLLGGHPRFSPRRNCNF